MDLDALLHWQSEHGLNGIHVVTVGESGFHLAHTDTERIEHRNTSECPVHRWLTEHDKAPAPVGLYMVVPHVVDAHSEPYPVAEYDLEPIR